MKDFAKAVEMTTKDGRLIWAEITPEDCHLIHMAMGISGEAGELLDAVKKAVIYRQTLNRENVIEELGDLEFYMEGLRKALNITRAEVLEANMKKLSVRYPQLRYSDSAATERADKPGF